MTEIKASEYSRLLNDIKGRIRNTQYEALREVNKKLTGLYFDIGRLIVNRQKGKTWGKSVVEKLGKDLQNEFPGIKGFSGRNIWRMRGLYLTYVKNPKLPPLVAEIGWSHNIIILEKCKDDVQREFYIRMTRKFGWTKNVLIHQIDSQTFEKALLNETNFDKTMTVTSQKQATLAVKNEYLFDFLELGEEYNEQQLQKALLSRIESFLKELGGLFAFIGSQYQVEVGGKQYYIDILLYHRRLQCLDPINLERIAFIQSHYRLSH